MMKILLLLLVSQTLTYTIPTLSQWQNEDLKTILVTSQHDFEIGFQIDGTESSEIIHCQVESCVCDGPLQRFECYQNKTMVIESKTSGEAFLLGNPFHQNRLTQTTTLVTYTDTDLTSSIAITSGLTLKWQVNTDSTVDFALSWSQNSWVGIGLQNTMTNTDMWIFQLSSGNVQALDSWSTGQSTPSQDAQQDLKIISQQVGTTGYKVRFNRKLNTGDTKDQVLVSGQSYTFSYAYSSSSTIQQHTTQSSFKITLSNSQVSTSTKFGQLLAIVTLMMFAF